MSDNVSVIIPAAGQGNRLGAGVPKAFLQYKNKTLIEHVLDTLEKVNSIKRILVGVPAEKIVAAKQLLKDRAEIYVGGTERGNTVSLGLQKLAATTDSYVLVHDAARPFITKDLVERLLVAVRKTPAVIPVIPVKDSLKLLDEQQEVADNLPRNKIVAVQTPQAYQLDLLKVAYKKGNPQLATDESELVMNMGHKVKTIPGEEIAHKITTPADIAFLEYLLNSRGKEEK